MKLTRLKTHFFSYQCAEPMFRFTVPGLRPNRPILKNACKSTFRLYAVLLRWRSCSPNVGEFSFSEMCRAKHS